MSIKLIHVHGFGGKNYNEKFLDKVRKVLRELNLETKISTDTFKWDSQRIKWSQIPHDWNIVKDRIPEITKEFIDYLKDESEKYSSIYITAFSIGAQIVSELINQNCNIVNSMNIKGIFFMGAALPKNFKFNDYSPIKIFNYYSNSNDKVLSQMYNRMEGEKSGGQVGFEDNENFINLPTNCSHIFNKTYYKELAHAISSIVIYWELRDYAQDFTKDYSTLKIKNYNKYVPFKPERYNKIIESEKIFIAQRTNMINKIYYYTFDKIKNNLIERSDSLVVLLEKYNLLKNKYDNFDKKISTPIKIRRILKDLDLMKNYSLDECQMIFASILKVIDKNESMKITYLGLDMNTAWDYFHNYFTEYKLLYNLEIKGLMLSCEIKEDYPDSVKNWCRNVRGSHDKIKKTIDWAISGFSENKKNILFDFREYSQLPRIHGWKINRPIEIWFVGQCKWDEKINFDYDWGMKDYTIYFKGNSDVEGIINQNIAEIFDGEYNFLWQKSKQIPGLNWNNKYED